MKTLIIFLIILVIVSLTNINYLSGSLNDLIPGELIIVNSSNANIKAKVYPIGAFFNGDLKYSIDSKFYPDRKILGGSKDSLIHNSHFTLDHDNAEGSGADSIIGFGKYRVVFLLYNINSHEYDSVDYCDVDYSDADYYYENFNDITFRYYSNDSITFEFNGGTTNKIQTADRSLKIWDQYGGQVHKTQNKNGFKSDSIYIIYPINTISYGAVDHINPGEIFINLQINDSINTRDTNPYDITVKKNAYLILEQGKILNIITPSYPSNGFTNLIVEDSAFINLKPNSKIYVENRNRMTLKYGSKLIKWANSEIIFNPGSLFCNEGGKIIGQGSLIFQPGYHSYCEQLVETLLEDSTKLILEDSSVVEIPNNITLHLKGNTTSLILKPGSKLLFGENSGITCDSGGKLIAINAVFASIDSTKKWNGISLSDLSQDTIKNCTIKNAMYGICVSDKYDAEESPFPYSTEISGCSFINQTNYVLNNGVYIAGSNNILIMNNTISSTSLEKGFTHGIYAEYCPEGNFDIINNTISNSGNGMTLIGCSPFVAQNTLTGNEYFDCF